MNKNASMDPLCLRCLMELLELSGCERRTITEGAAGINRTLAIPGGTDLIRATAHGPVGTGTFPHRLYIVRSNPRDMERMILIVTLFLCFTTAMAQVPDYVPTDGLVAWYPFNGNGNDLSGTGNDATNNGATFLDDRFGTANSAASFNGTSSYMSVASPTFSLSYSGSFTYSVWINKQAQPLAGIVMMTGTGASGNFISIIQGSSNEVFGTTMQGSAWTYINCPHTLNNWDHYVGTYDGGEMEWYKNGAFQSSGTSPYTLAATLNMPLYIGKGISTGNFLGAIDDIGIWERVLTPTEISDLYNALSTGTDEVAINASMTVSPNPAFDMVRLHVQDDLVGSDVAVIDPAGREVLSSRIRSAYEVLDLGTLNAGMYGVRLTKGELSITRLLVICE